MSETKELTLNANVVEVTLMEDRARVVRRGKIKLSAGVIRLKVENVSPLISDKTLTGRSVDGDQAQVVSTIVKREHHEMLPEGDPERVRKELDIVSRKIERLRDAKKQTRLSLGALNEMEERTLHEMAYDASWALAKPEDWNRNLATIDERMESIHGLIEERSRELRDLHGEQRQLERELATASSVSAENRFRIEALVNVAMAGEYTVEFEYVVPSACWRPSSSCWAYHCFISVPRSSFR